LVCTLSPRPGELTKLNREYCARGPAREGEAASMSLLLRLFEVAEITPTV
jgi:hypothetical protein